MIDRQMADARDARTWAAKRRYVATAFGEIAYVEQGDGDAALFLHGFPLNGFRWRDAMPRLADVRRCIALDSLGLGYTRTRPGQGLAFADQVAMILAFLDQIGTETVEIVANDSNTGVAQLLAARHPQRVRSLLLTNGDTEPDSPPAALMPIIELGQQGRLADDIFVAHLQDEAMAQSPQGVGGLCYQDPRNLTRPALDFYLAPLVQTPERKAFANAYAAAMFPNPLTGLEAELRRVRAPVRIVWGMSDVFFSQDSPAYLDRLFVNSRGVRAIPEAKLFLPEEYPGIIEEEARRLWTTPSNTDEPAS